MKEKTKTLAEKVADLDNTVNNLAVMAMSTLTQLTELKKAKVVASSKYNMTVNGGIANFNIVENGTQNNA